MVGYAALTCSALSGIVFAASAVIRLRNQSEYGLSRATESTQRQVNEGA